MLVAAQNKKQEIRNGYYLTKYGMLVDSKDVDGFSIALKQLIELKDLRKNLGTKGQKHVLQNSFFPETSRVSLEALLPNTSRLEIANYTFTDRIVHDVVWGWYF